jgi:hypothetical protein
MTEPLVPIGLPPAQQAMSISAAMRQAAVDAAHLPPGVSFGYVWEQGKGGAAILRVQARNVYGAVVWEQPYDGRGHRVTVGAGLLFGGSKPSTPAK